MFSLKDRCLLQLTGRNNLLILEDSSTKGEKLAEEKAKVENHCLLTDVLLRGRSGKQR